jgi:hypothetical protein
MEIARRDRWKTSSMPARTSELAYSAEFSQAEFERISRGLVPREMENKWFIFLEDGCLFFHRSWTGHCIYRVELEPLGDKHVVRCAEANRDPDEYKQTDDAYDSELLSFLVDVLLLGKRRDFPVPPGAESPRGVYQHVVAGTGLREEPATRRPWWKFW